MRLAGLIALVNGFGAFDVPAIWHLAHDQEIWNAMGNPTYGNGPFEDHGIDVTVPVLHEFLSACLVPSSSPAAVIRTITDRRRCRSIPTN